MSPQQTIAHYRITAKLGAGGMGEVWRATDTKLNRDVAIKVLPDSFAADPDRMARFAREAQVLASLNHPNIAAIYGVEERALVMELVEGSTLSGPLPLADALPIIHQIIDALEYAHEKGIVHRDLKPANIQITPEGRVKVLDFGLAKAMSSDAPAGDPVTSPTLTMRATVAGMIMGTAAYMAPEQARGHDVDKRADIWAFGVVVYELLTGRLLFDGPTVSDTLAAVLTRDPDVSAVPVEVRRLLQLCLVRDPRKRLRDISGARVALELPVAAAPAAAAPVRTSRLLPAIAVALALIGALSLGLFWRATRPVDHPLTRLSVDLGPNAIFGPDITAAISPDGTRIAFSVRGPDGFQLATRGLDEDKTTILPGAIAASSPFFSPDGQWIAFFANRKLKKIAVHGGAPMDICDASVGRGGAWAEDGTIVAALDSTHLSRVPAGGGAPEDVTKAEGDKTQRWPQFLPGGKTVLFTSHTYASADYEDANLAVVSLKTGATKIVHRGGYFGRYLPSGHLVYVHRGTLFAVPFELAALETRGSPVPVVEDVGANAAWGAGNLDVSQTGTLVFLSGKYDLVRPHVWIDSAGKAEPLRSPTGTSPHLSPDGARLALSVNGDIAVYDLRSDTTTRLTFNPAADNRIPVWAPDGKHLVYSPGAGGIWWIRADGSGQPQHILTIPGNAAAWSFSPDGRRLAYHAALSTTSRDIWILPLDLTDPDHPKPGKEQQFLATPSVDVDPAFSPDGRWLAYATNESGNYQVYVRGADGAGMWQVSAAPARFPVWSRHGNELLFQGLDSTIMVAGYTAQGGTFSAGKPRQWSNTPLWMTGNFQNFDLAPDGKRLLAALAPAAATSAHVTFLLNFFDELRRRVGRGDGK